jgi:endonuclease/exonuclease/phosphatase family metal-dependent hydrolase
MTFTMMGNNILQNFIHENKQDYDAPFAKLPWVRFAMFMKAYKGYHPDIIALQECDEGWHDVLDSADGLPSLGYAAATDGFTDESLRMIRNVLYYDKAKFTVEAAGYRMYSGTSHERIANPWCVSWAVLKAKEDGTRFAVSSTHFVWKSIDNWAERDRFAHELVPLLHEIEEKYGVPVVAMGDYNAHPGEPAYKTMCADFDSARLVAAEKVNTEYKTSIRYACLPDLYGDGTSCVDHCFITRERVLPDRYETVIDPEALIYTDHAPQRFTFRIR